MGDSTNYTTPENKARFGFKLDANGQVVSAGLKGGDNGAKVSGPTVVSDVEGAHNNGGGDAQPAANGNGADPRDSLTIPQIKEQLDAKGVTYASTLNKAELLELLKAQPSTQE